MSNELEGLGYQTEAPASESFEQPTGEQFEQEQETATLSQEQPQYFEVKYNKEPMQVSYDEAPDYIQKGLNYDKVNERATTYQSELDRVARLSGYESYEEMQGALDTYEQDLQAQQWRDQGIDPEAMNQFLEQHPDIQYAREMKQKEADQQTFNSHVEEFMREHPDVKPEDITDDVWNLRESKGLTLTEAFRLANWSTVNQSAQQKAIQSLQQNAASSPGSLGAQGAEHNKGISGLSSEEFAKLQRQVLNGERTSF